jgi:hypothetical protein
MKHEKYRVLKKHLKKKGITVSWWVRNYLPYVNHSTVMSQFHGLNPMRPDVLRVIENYLKGENNDCRN